MSLTPAEQRLKKLLNVLASVYLLAIFIFMLGPVVGPFKDFFKQLPFVSNSVVMTSLLMLLCRYAAGDLRRRIDLVAIFIAGHFIAIVGMLLFLMFADTSRIWQLGSTSLPAVAGLWLAILINLAIAAVVLIFYAKARVVVLALDLFAWFKQRLLDMGRRVVSIFGLLRREKLPAEITTAERWLQRVLVGLGVFFALGAVSYVLGTFLSLTKSFFIELPFVANSVVKTSVLAMLGFYIAKDLRPRMSLVTLIVFSHLLSMMVQFFFILATDTGVAVTFGGRPMTLNGILWRSIMLDAVIAAGLVLIELSAWKARYNLVFLRPIEFRTLIALADILVHGPEEKIPAVEIAANVDVYVSRIHARRRWVYYVVLFGTYLHPLLYFKAPFAELDEETRLRHLKKYFYKDSLWTFLPDWWNQLVQAMIRIGKQLTYVGYYNDPRSFDSVGYCVFSERSRFKKLPIPENKIHPLKVDRPSDLNTGSLETDICIIGSGAAGAILAYHLAKAGHQVLVVERGKYTQPSDMTHDEIEMVGRLYADGVFQQTTDYRFTVLQGSCIGGSTVVNNAVCFPPPEHVLARWNDPGQYDAGLDLKDLQKSIEYINAFLPITKQDHDKLNPTGKKFLEGVKKLRDKHGFEGEMEVDPVRANIKDCLGCGYCNIGCAYGKKLSMLDTALPWAQERFPGKLSIVAECEVRRFNTQGDHVVSVEAQMSDGRKLTIHAKKYVLAAGAIASSYLLLRSKIGGNLPVGKQFSCNMGAAVTGEFDEKLNAYDGLQISHYGLPKPWRGFVYETWWNPPVSQAISMPGWFEDHYENMRRFDHMMGVGVLVGTASNGQVKRALTGGPDLAFVPEKRDLKTLGEGLKLLGKILFEAGARRVMINTWMYDVFKEPKDLEKIDKIVLDPTYITLGSGHPQGGNAMSKDPKRGVVDPDFRVHGYKNLYVCDASVFPSSLTVNPQQTVMSLAHYAASRIA